MFKNTSITISKLIEEIALVTPFFRSTGKLLNIMENVTKEKKEIQLLRLISSIQNTHEIKLASITEGVGRGACNLLRGDINYINNNINLSFQTKNLLQVTKHIPK